MKTYKKITIMSLLILIVFSFSGCSIKKIENGSKNKKTEVKKQKEVKIIDTDGDGLKDEEEKVLGTDINKFDTDNDGLNDFEEVKNWKTDPLNSDTDGDGYLDGQEIDAGYDPLGPGQLDIDNDGLGNADEKKIGTDPEKFDTDGDGLSDKEEIDMGSNPLIKE
jgi:hypothetical protein